MGFGSLELGPLGLIEAAVILAILVVRFRSFPERAGGYLLGVSVVPIILLGSIVTRMPSCDAGLSRHGECYATITGPALIAYALVGLVGAGLLAFALGRLLAHRTA